LLKRGVCGVSRLDFAINDKVLLRHWTEPDFMISFALANKLAALGFQNLFE